MLYFRIAIILLVLDFTSSLKNDIKLHKKYLLAKPKNCENIKCPSVEKPICVRLVHKSAEPKVNYVVMINKCEMNYVKCHEGLEAQIVPMKICGHNNRLQTEKKRVKRQAASDEPTTEVDEEVTENPTEESEVIEEEVTEESEVIVEEVTEEPEVTEQPLFTEDPDVVDDPVTDIIEDIAAPEPLDLDVIKEPVMAEYLEMSEKLEADEPGVTREIDAPEPEMKEPQTADSNTNLNEQNIEESGDAYPLPDDPNASKNAVLIIEDDGKQLKHDSYPKQQEDEQADLEQYNEDCPTVCPARDVMVCGKCQHNVYKTFLSVCHMRMSQCSHNFESLELVARYPCAMSAPFLQGSNMQPQGRVVEPNDHDEVLRFIICREKTLKSREADERCNFRNKQDKKLSVKLELNYVNDDY